MKISESDISLSSSHHKQSQVQEMESLEMWNKDEDAPQRLRQVDRLELTDEFKHIYNGTILPTSENEIEEASLDPKLMSIVRVIESLTGKKVDLSFIQNIKSSQLKAQKDISVESSEAQRLGWGIDYRYERTEIKKESLDFSAHGNVKTQNGKSIEFSLALSMKNDLKISESISFKAGDALIDPLVLNFGSDTVNISDVKHSFDLDLDGKSEEFSFVGSGSGFLSLDKNKDGIINNGSELFGPKNGNGFEELSMYDSDKNNWIDENDAVFDELLIWTKDESGEENLYSLAEKGVGALYLGTASTEFEFYGSDLQKRAQMRDSSIYMKEDGRIGTLQEVDLVV